MGKGWPYAAAAAAVDVPERPIPPVLVLAKPIDEAARSQAGREGARRGAALRRQPSGHRDRRRRRSGRCCAPPWAPRPRGRSTRRADGSLGRRGQRRSPRAVAVDVRERRRRGARRGEHGHGDHRRHLVGRRAAGADGAVRRVPRAAPCPRAEPAASARDGRGAAAPRPASDTPGAGLGAARRRAGSGRPRPRSTAPTRRCRPGAPRLLATSASAATCWSISSARAAWPRSSRPSPSAPRGSGAPSWSSACAPSCPATRPSSRSSSTRRTSPRRWCTRTSSRCSTSARSATSTSWPRSTSSAAISAASTARTIERDGTPLAPPVVLFAAAETLQALEYAHTKLGDSGRPLGIVHRDVSPSNVLVSARGEVKLFDFGIVKAEGRVTKTQHGVVKGNVSFMSPEQARGIDVDARADLFSLGLVIYYCLTGDVLYRGKTTYELLVKAATGPGPEELRAHRRPPRAVRASILRKALQIDPAQRYQTAAEFAAALAPYATGGAAAAAALMSALFAEDFRAEEARFAAAVPSSGDRSPAAHRKRRPRAATIRVERPVRDVRRSPRRQRAPRPADRRRRPARAARRSGRPSTARCSPAARSASSPRSRWSAARRCRRRCCESGRAADGGRAGAPRRRRSRSAADHRRAPAPGAADRLRDHQPPLRGAAGRRRPPRAASI